MTDIRCFSTFPPRCTDYPSNEVPRLTHIDPTTGRPSMVNVSAKASSTRSAAARGRIILPSAAYQLVAGTPSPPGPTDPDVIHAQAKARAKGDVLVVAQLAGIMAAKRTADLIPLCHPLALSHVSVVLSPETKAPDNGKGEPVMSVLCEATVSCEGKTGVEMEALTAASAALLTVWDMLKAVAGREMVITDILVSRKTGGKSGDFQRDVDQP